MRSLRQTVAEQMVEAHGISFDLARWHVGLMEPKEVKRRFLWYVRNRLPGAELSASPIERNDFAERARPA